MAMGYDPGAQMERPPTPNYFWGGQCADILYSVYGQVKWDNGDGGGVRLANFAINSGNRFYGPIRSMEAGPGVLRLTRATGQQLGGVTFPTWILQYVQGFATVVVDPGAANDNCGNPLPLEEGSNRRPDFNPDMFEPTPPPLPPVFDLDLPIPLIPPLPPDFDIPLPDFDLPPLPDFDLPPLPDFDLPPITLPGDRLPTPPTNAAGEPLLPDEEGRAPTNPHVDVAPFPVPAWQRLPAAA